MLAIVVLPASLMITFGHLTRRPRAGWILLAVMLVLFVTGLAVCDRAEAQPPPQLAGLHIQGANMEGKDVRFGAGESVLTAVVTSNASTGSYNSMHGSFQPLGVAVPLIFMLLGEVVFGGLGAGVYSIVIPAMLGVFLGGLMVGRSPEYLGKQIASGETRWIALYTILTPKAVLALATVAVASKAGLAGLVTNTGPRGFTEIVFAYASCMANNGQTMAGLNANSVFYNYTTSIAIVAGRYGLAAMALALAGRLAAQPRRPVTPGTLPCDTPAFGALVFGTIVLVGALCFLPALSLGPIVEFLQQ
jgi:K+-transporting ATPase ATPase A chain